VPLTESPDGPAEEGAAETPDPRLGLAGSSYLEVIHGLVSGRPPRVDLALERRLQAFLRQAIAADLVASAHDLSDGGLAVAAAEACIGGDLGVDLALPFSSTLRLDRLLFAEGGARLLVSVPVQAAGRWQAALEAAAASAAPVPATRLGSVQAEPRLRLSQGRQVLVEQAIGALRSCFEQAIPRRLGVDLPPDD
jgi:phosphoribosylformylglycinamidine synthase